jgi:predicted MFS family arabinose efflux permease
MALLADAFLLLGSALILRGVPAREETPPAGKRQFWAELREGLRFVIDRPLLRTMAAVVGAWQLCHGAMASVQILHASRDLALSESSIGLCFAMLGAATLLASAWGDRLSNRHGPGPTLVLGFALCATGWLLPPLAAALQLPPAASVAAFMAMLVLDGAGGLLLYINFLALRQSVTPPQLLGRMTATMRWLILLPAPAGALLGGWLGGQLGLTGSLAAAGLVGWLAVLLAWRTTGLPAVRALPDPDVG